MTSFNAAVVGVGAIGESHARIYAEHPLVNLAAIVDIDEQQAKSVGREFGADVIESDLSAVLESEDVDLVTVATPEEHHLPPVRTALEADCHVLVEKPIAATEENAREIGRLAEEASTKMTVGYVCRYDPRYARLKEELDEFGELLALHAARVSSNWGYFRRGAQSRPEYYLGVHDIDLLRWYVESEVVRVYASASDGLDDIDTPAIVTANLEFEDGTIATLETNWARTQEHPSALSQSIRVTGTDGYGETGFEVTGSDVPVATDADGFHFGDESEIHGERQDFLRREIDHFIDCILADEEPLITWEDGLESLKVAHAIMESIETSEPVDLSE